MTKRRRRLELIAEVALVSLLLYAFVEPFLLRVREVVVCDEDVPAEFDGLRIAFLADFHCSWFFPPGRVAGVVERTNALAPDLVVLGGDYVHSGSDYVDGCFAELAKLRAPMGVYGVLGNHDHWGAAEAARQAMDRAGIVSLDNRAAWLERGRAHIKLGGVGDFWEDRHDIQPIVHDLVSADFAMLVSHNPDTAETLTTDLVDVVLAGHTHGGQVTLFGLWAPVMPSDYGQKYRSGTVAAPHTTVVLTNGAGGPPIRFCARPEIVLVTLRHEEPLP